MDLIEIAKRGCEAHARYDEICTTLDEDDPAREAALAAASNEEKEALRQAAAIPHRTQGELIAKLMLVATCTFDGDGPDGLLYPLAQSCIVEVRQ